MRISPENAATFYALVKKVGLKNTEVVLTGVTPGGEYKVARNPEARYGGGDFNSYYGGQTQWGERLLCAAPMGRWWLLRALEMATPTTLTWQGY